MTHLSTMYVIGAACSIFVQGVCVAANRVTWYIVSSPTTDV